MKIEILKENLKNGLGIVEKVVGKNLSLPILDNVHIETEESFLILTSTDLETAIRLWILTKIIKKGNAVIPAKFLSSFITSLPNEKITIEGEGQNLHITCNNVKTEVKGFNSEDFPIIPKLSEAHVLEIDNKKFCQGLTQVIDMASPSQTRPEISGIYFSFVKNIVKMVATDSFRLAEKSITLESPTKKDSVFILPQKPARELLAILDGKEGILKIHISSNQVMFEFPMKEVDHPQLQVTSRLIEGEYPNYQDIIPTKFKTQIVVARDEFLSQVKTASLFSGKVHEVKIMVNPEKNQVGIFAKSTDVGENNATMSAKIEGELIEISFNYKFLIDGLLKIKSSEVMLDFSSSEGPCILRPVGDTSYLCVLMPIKAL